MVDTCQNHTMCHANVPGTPLDKTERLDSLNDTDDRILLQDEKIIVTELALDDWLAQQYEL